MGKQSKSNTTRDLPVKSGSGSVNQQPKRHKEDSKNARMMKVRGLTKSSIRSIAARAGTSSIKQEVFDESRNQLDDFFVKILQNAIYRVNGRGSKQVTYHDIDYALKDSGIQMINI